MRQWRVVIQDIECVNQTANIINPFVKFIIGGNYYVSSRLALAPAADILTDRPSVMTDPFLLALFITG